ncbi:cytochrome c3 family protein [Megalodesulfovibrio gigas]|uniref:Cytochrome c class III n=1 Tax=Megalodesulfovibrio gigas (strain ATCC 19364 / DSM 1382 / NCIMB 9332 / VKM B-1759) TaxID=1121448 RepID=T2G7I8_MEGG1|nr:cytochrome c3 family protein [Megalodesulfovibrio gigas]AGW12253.1 cytochrome c class III [Megalodesulfovibrio gigas DSM 1382 = ATCC 19364]
MPNALPACLVLSVVLLAAAVGAVAAPQSPSSPLTLRYLKKEVVFPHAAHGALECRTCHHPWDGENPMPKCSEAGCHDVFDAKDKSEKSFYKIVHGPGAAAAPSCLACHKDTAAKNPERKKVLTGCAGSACHPS